jgi:hypothetical protein
VAHEAAEAEQAQQATAAPETRQTAPELAARQPAPPPRLATAPAAPEAAAARNWLVRRELPAATRAMEGTGAFPTPATSERRPSPLDSRVADGPATVPIEATNDRPTAVEARPPVATVANMPMTDAPARKAAARPSTVPSDRNLLPIALAIGLILIAVLAYLLTAGFLG